MQEISGLDVIGNVGKRGGSSETDVKCKCNSAINLQSTCLHGVPAVGMQPAGSLKATHHAMYMSP